MKTFDLLALGTLILAASIIIGASFLFTNVSYSLVTQEGVQLGVLFSPDIDKIVTRYCLKDDSKEIALYLNSSNRSFVVTCLHRIEATNNRQVANPNIIPQLPVTNRDEILT